MEKTLMITGCRGCLFYRGEESSYTDPECALGEYVEGVESPTLPRTHRGMPPSCPLRNNPITLTLHKG